MKKKILNTEERIALHRKMALGYHHAYDGDKSKDLVSFEGWSFAKDALYASPYFTGDKAYPMSTFSVNATEGTTNETQAYLLSFPDWRQTEFEYWAADDGFVMKTHWEGTHIKTGKRMGFYSYSFIKTNEYGEVVRWETHTNEAYSDFLEVAIGVRGPFHGKEAYNEALKKVLKNKYIG